MSPLIRIILVAALVPSVYLLRLPATSFAAPSAESVAPVGQITIEGNGSVDGLPVMTGATIFSGEELTTGEDARTVIYLDENTRYILAPGSCVRLFLVKEGETLAHLHKGSVRLSVPAQAAASVRTDYGVIQSGDGHYSDFTVDVAEGGGQVAVHAGRAKLEGGDRLHVINEGDVAVSGVNAATAGQGNPGNNLTGKQLGIWLAAIGAAVVTAVAIIVTTGDGDDNLPIDEGGMPIAPGFSPTR